MAGKAAGPRGVWDRCGGDREAAHFDVPVDPPRTEAVDTPRARARTQDLPSLLLDPPEASSSCREETTEAPGRPARTRAHTGKGRAGLPPGVERRGLLRAVCLWCQLSAKERRSSWFSIAIGTRAPSATCRWGGRGRSIFLSSLTRPPPPAPLAEDEKSSRKEILLSLFRVFCFCFSFKFSLRQKFGKASLRKAA